MADNELGAFLRARREAVSPAEVGLPAGPRRRTPGLRRAELATLAGVSVEYLTRLEQGRDRRPSTAVLAALATALRLPLDAHQHLRMLAKAGDGGRCGMAEPPPNEVRPTVLALLERLEPTPALLLNRVNDVLAYTSGFDRVARSSGLLDPPRPNLARYVFTDPRARAVFLDWTRVADEQVAHLRTQAVWDGRHTARLARELAAEPAFDQRWHAAPVLPAATGVERWAHPEAGELRLAYEILDLAPADEQRLVVHLPADAATAAALDRLTGRRPGGLHALSG